jgi:hypothetical protein
VVGSPGYDEGIVRLTDGLFLGSPSWAGLRDGLERARLILGPHVQIHLLAEAVRPLDHLFLGVASGSVVRTTDPSFPFRNAEPVWHQVRLCCQEYPASHNVDRRLAGPWRRRNRTAWIGLMRLRLGAL